MAKIHKQEARMEVRLGLAEEEREPLVKQLLAARKQQDKLELAKKDAVSSFNADIKEQVEIIDEVCMTLERGKPEMRDVVVIKNFSSGTVKVQDVETGRIVEEREMTDDDKQMAIGENAGEEDSAEAPKGKKAKKLKLEVAQGGDIPPAP